MPEKTSVHFTALSEAHDFVTVDGAGGNCAYVSRATGEIFWSSSEIDEEVPDDVDDPARYAVVPDRHALDLGTRLVSRFVADEAPELGDRVSRIFEARGAYGRFRELLRAEGRLDAWYAFEEACTKEALREWCESEGFTLVEQ